MTMRRCFLALSILTLTAPQVASAACSLGATCTTGSILFNNAAVRCCDRIISQSSWTADYSTTAECDNEGLASSSTTKDGICTICNASGWNSTLTGSNSTNVTEAICGGDGNDIIDGRGGNDTIMGGSGNDQLTGGSGADELHGDEGYDVIVGGTGNDNVTDVSEDAYVEGGSGDDFIWTYTGDDQIYGGDGNDNIISGPGGDWVEGGNDNDVISSIVYGDPEADDDYLGPTYCGGSGNDNIQARGPAHTCIDGGTGTDTCQWLFHISTRDQTAFDVATALNCETATGMDGRQPNCGCP